MQALSILDPKSPSAWYDSRSRRGPRAHLAAAGRLLPKFSSGSPSSDDEDAGRAAFLEPCRPFDVDVDVDSARAAPAGPSGSKLGGLASRSAWTKRFHL